MAVGLGKSVSHCRSQGACCRTLLRHEAMGQTWQRLLAAPKVWSRGLTSRNKMAASNLLSLLCAVSVLYRLDPGKVRNIYITVGEAYRDVRSIEVLTVHLL